LIVLDLVQSHRDGHRSLVTPERVLRDYNEDLILLRFRNNINQFIPIKYFVYREYFAQNFYLIPTFSRFSQCAHTSLCVVSIGSIVPCKIKKKLGMIKIKGLKVIQRNCLTDLHIFQISITILRVS